MKYNNSQLNSNIRERQYCLYLHLTRLFRDRSRTPAIGGEWPSGLRLCNHIRRIPTGTWLGIETKPLYESPGDLLGRNKKIQ